MRPGWSSTRRSCLNHTTAAVPPSRAAVTGAAALEATIRLRLRLQRRRGAGMRGPRRSVRRAMGGAARRRQQQQQP
uniref:Uncharacterized protein n=1 Tax=Arundo donax TaxID=35708 RepID=A0A0A9CWP4_ARUDO